MGGVFAPPASARPESPAAEYLQDLPASQEYCTGKKAEPEGDSQSAPQPLTSFVNGVSRQEHGKPPLQDANIITFDRCRCQLSAVEEAVNLYIVDLPVCDYVGRAKNGNLISRIAFGLTFVPVFADDEKLVGDFVFTSDHFCLFIF